MSIFPKRKYIMMISESLVKEYGSTLVEFDTDLLMAKAVVKKMRKYLLNNDKDLTEKQFKLWRDKFLNELGVEK